MVWFARQGSGSRSEGDLICDNYLGGPTTELRVRRELRTEGGLTQQSGLFGVFLLSRELLSTDFKATREYYKCVLLIYKNKVS